MYGISWETHARFLPCLYLFPGNTCAFPVSDGNTSQFQTQHVNSGSTFLIHTRFHVTCYASACKHIRVSVLYSVWGKNTCAFPMCLCLFAKNTCAFPLSFSLFARNTRAFPPFPIPSRDMCTPSFFPADPQFCWRCSHRSLYKKKGFHATALTCHSCLLFPLLCGARS